MTVQPVTRLVLVRHGEPDALVRGRCYGRLDAGLSPAGLAQMREVRRLLTGLHAAAVYSSPRRRALEAATSLVDDPSRLIVDERLREIDFGRWEGLTYDQIAARYPELYRQWMRHPTEVEFPGGESFPAMSARVCGAFDEIRRAHRGGCAVVVSHGGVNRIVLADALGMTPSRMFRLDQAYACVNVVDYFDDEPVVRALNVRPGGRAC